jgi:hypothetical protein
MSKTRLLAIHRIGYPITRERVERERERERERELAQ